MFCCLSVKRVAKSVKYCPKMLKFLKNVLNFAMRNVKTNGRSSPCQDGATVLHTVQRCHGVNGATVPRRSVCKDERPFVSLTGRCHGATHGATEWCVYPFIEKKQVNIQYPEPYPILGVNFGYH